MQMAAGNSERFLTQSWTQAHKWVLKEAPKVSNTADAEETQGWAADNSHTHLVS